MLDINVLSEMMAPTPDQTVAEWIVGQPSDELFTAAVCQAEILAGIGVLPAGLRRSALEAAARAVSLMGEVELLRVERSVIRSAMRRSKND